MYMDISQHLYPPLWRLHGVGVVGHDHQNLGLAGGTPLLHVARPRYM